MERELSTTTEHYRKVREFMDGAKQDCPPAPCIPDEKIRLLRAKLILEEALETVEALGFEMYPDIGDGDELRGYALVKSIHEPNLVEIVDGCCDIKVVTTGTLIACGVRDNVVQNMVDGNNLEKLKNGTIRDDGKLIKPPGHKPPDIAGYLAGEGYQPESEPQQTPPDGWECARMLVGWFEGQTQQNAREQVERMEKAYKGATCDQ